MINNFLISYYKYILHLAIKCHCNYSTILNISQKLDIYITRDLKLQIEKKG